MARMVQTPSSPRRGARRFRYFTSCVGLDHKVGELHQMIEEATEVTYQTFRRRVMGLDEWAVNHGYELHPARGLTLKNDWHVGYYKSRFDGVPCYFLRWSAFEHIWVEDTCPST